MECPSAGPSSIPQTMRIIDDRHIYSPPFITLSVSTESMTLHPCPKTMMGDEQQELIIMKTRMLAAQYTAGAALTVFIYDIFLSFHDEVRITMKSR